jgi:hypothetical protein
MLLIIFSSTSSWVARAMTGTPGFDQGQRAVFQFAAGIGFSMNIGDFLQFQGTFHSQAVVHGTADEKYVFFIFESTCRDL